MVTGPRVQPFQGLSLRGGDLASRNAQFAVTASKGAGEGIGALINVAGRLGAFGDTPTTQGLFGPTFAQAGRERAENRQMLVDREADRRTKTFVDVADTLGVDVDTAAKLFNADPETVTMAKAAQEDREFTEARKQGEKVTMAERVTEATTRTREQVESEERMSEFKAISKRIAELKVAQNLITEDQMEADAAATERSMLERLTKNAKSAGIDDKTFFVAANSALAKVSEQDKAKGAALYLTATDPNQPSAKRNQALAQLRALQTTTDVAQEDARTRAAGVERRAKESVRLREEEGARADERIKQREEQVSRALNAKSEKERRDARSSVIEDTRSLLAEQRRLNAEFQKIDRFDEIGMSPEQKAQNAARMTQINQRLKEIDEDLTVLGPAARQFARESVQEANRPTREQMITRASEIARQAKKQGHSEQAIRESIRRVVPDITDAELDRILGG